VRLRRIEAVRFGAFENDTVGDLSDTLTVVHGPNEAGKSTLIALVRSVLYGFHTKSQPDAYLSPAGARAGRLVFEDADGEWAIERLDGPRGGPVAVRTLRGSDRPGLLEELTRGVDESTYQIVFGFGLDEMAKIEEARKDRDSIAGALYAASAGLRVSPESVRKELESERDVLFLPRGERRIGRWLKDLDEVRKRIREAREAGQRFAEDKARLQELQREHDSLKREAEEAQAVTQRIAADLQRVTAAVERAASLARDEASIEEEQSALRAQMASTHVDERLVAAADTLEALTHRVQAVAQAVLDAERHRERARSSAVEFERACASVGLSLETVRAVAVDGPLAAAVRSALEDITRLEAQLTARREAAVRADAAAERARFDAARALEPLGLDASATLHDLERLSIELDASHDAVRARRDRGPAVLMVVLGAFIFVLGGILLKETVSLVAGPVVTALGIFALWREVRTGGGAAQGQDAARQRRLVEIARAAVISRDAAVADAEQARIEAESAEAAVTARKEILARDLEANGLPRDLDASQAVAVLDIVRQAQRHDEDAQAATVEADRSAATVSAFVEEVGSAALAAGFTGSIATFEDAKSALSVLMERLRENRERADRLRKIQAQLAQLEARASELKRQREEAEAQARTILECYEQAYASIEGLRVLLEQARSAEASLVARKEEVAAERSRLEERLESLGSDELASQARLDEAALVCKIEEAVEQFTVLALGVRLLAAAQERYEQERQPDVIKNAARIFGSITGERYRKVVVPVGSGRIEVYDERAEAKDTGKLSKGTAEALYLALRLGLLGRLDGVAPALPVLVDDVLANFDPERLDGALRAITELSQKRQVVFFTCHSDVAERLMAAGPQDAVRIDLDKRR